MAADPWMNRREEEPGECDMPNLEYAYDRLAHASMILDWVKMPGGKQMTDEERQDVACRIHQVRQELHVALRRLSNIIELCRE